jgi:hypothetical protein
MHLSQPAIIGCIFLLLVPLWVLLRREFIKGFSYAVFLCVLMPTYLRIEVSGGLPQLTIYRLVLMSVFVFWLGRGAVRNRLAETPLLLQLCLWAGVSLISLFLTTITFATSLKRFLDFVLEIYLFYLVLSTSIRTSEDAFRVIRAAWLGVTLVAVLAVVERYSGFNPVYFLISDEELGPHHDVVATYQHRILLGVGMAMGYPLALGFLTSTDERTPRRLYLWGSLALFLAASYYAQSRGPWLAAILAGCVLMRYASSFIRRKLLFVAIVGLLAVAARPGVWETLSDRLESSTDSRSFKGGTLQYRLELWKVAWAQVTKSTDTFFFGYGPGCGSETEIDWKLSYRGQEYEISSWDNEFAYDLYQGGVFGLAASVALYGSALLFMYRCWRKSEPPNKDLVLCLFASAVAMVFMRTNVLIFAKQLSYLFWTVVAAAPALARATVREREDSYVLDDEMETASALPGKA